MDSEGKMFKEKANSGVTTWRSMEFMANNELILFRNFDGFPSDPLASEDVSLQVTGAEMQFFLRLETKDPICDVLLIFFWVKKHNIDSSFQLLEKSQRWTPKHLVGDFPVGGLGYPRSYSRFLTGLVFSRCSPSSSPTRTTEQVLILTGQISPFTRARSAIFGKSHRRPNRLAPSPPSISAFSSAEQNKGLQAATIIGHIQQHQADRGTPTPPRSVHQAPSSSSARSSLSLPPKRGALGFIVVGRGRPPEYPSIIEPLTTERIYSHRASPPPSGSRLDHHRANPGSTTIVPSNSSFPFLPPSVTPLEHPDAAAFFTDLRAIEGHRSPIEHLPRRRRNHRRRAHHALASTTLPCDLALDLHHVAR
ncbi:hypothetical protein Dimus_015517 [Dionaea muscipula]